MIALKIVTTDQDSNFYDYNVDAMIDSGSLISLNRVSFVFSKPILSINKDVTQFYGINGSRLKITGIFYGKITVGNTCVRIKFYTVPDETMAFRALLGRDFLKYPFL